MMQSSSYRTRAGSVRQSLLFAVILLLASLGSAHANPYLAKPGERHVSVRIATCAVSGGFTHLYTALDNKLFDKYGFRVDQVYIRGSIPALTALAADEIQFLYCAADATIPTLAAGLDVKLVAAPMVNPPHVLITRREIRRLEELRGKSLGVGRHGDVSDRLSKALVKKFNIPDVTIRPIGGSQSERYQAMAANLVQGVIITPPLDVRARNDGFNVLFRLMDLDIPFIYSSLYATSRFIHDRPDTVQRMVAAFAEAIHFAEKYPAKTKASISRVMRLKDDGEAQVAYNVYTKEIVDRRMIVPAAAVAESIEVARSLGTAVKKKPEELYDNSFVNNLERSGFLKELWGK